MFENMRVLTHRDFTSTTSNTAFLEAFSKEVWISVAALFILFTILKYLDTRFPLETLSLDDNESDSRIPKWKKKILKTIPLFRVRRAFQNVGTFFLQLL